MGKDLHYLILNFFRDRMVEHSKVIKIVQLDIDTEYVFHVVRIAGLPDINVHLSDAYRYTLYDYYAKPYAIREGDFILIARPEAEFDNNLVALAAKDKIGIGSIRKLMGALNRREVWKYHEPE